MNREKLFSTKERVKILKNILYLEYKFGVNEIARKLKLSKGLVSKYFEILSKEKILKKRDNKFQVADNYLVRALKIMFNLEKFDLRLFKKYKFVKAVGLYGSCAKGTNSQSSDVDLWIKVNNLNEKRIIELASELREKIENAKILFLDDKKIKVLKNKDPLFYYSLYFGSIITYGEENEI
jgi:predicted nucleotidyltransferase